MASNVKARMFKPRLALLSFFNTSSKCHELYGEGKKKPEKQCKYVFEVPDPYWGRVGTTSQTFDEIKYANKNNLTLLAWYDIYNNLIL